VASGQVPISIPVAFTDYGSDPGFPVSDEYYDDAPFEFNGTIEQSMGWYSN